MKKTFKILVPIILAIAILVCTAWYLFIYDRAFTRDMLLTFARQSEHNGSHSIAAWFYKQAYSQSSNSEAVAIELAEQYKAIGNYTKAEYTLSNAITDGASVDLYVALCKTYVQQDKILDALGMLSNITDSEIKEQIEKLRPSVPTVTPDPGHFNQYISVTVSAETGTLYVSTTEKIPSVIKDHYKEPITLRDGENTIYAVSVADNGLVSPLGIYGFTVGGVVKPMEFSDTAFETEVRNILGVSEEKQLYTNDLWTIKSFTMPFGARSYSDLVHMPFLESLVIENGVSEEIKHLSSLGNLTQLKITGTALSQDNMKAIGALPVLKELTLQNCRLTTTAALSDLTSLIILDLSNNTIRDISALAGMKSLQKLYLQSNAITDLSAISTCTALTQLNVSSNALTSLAPIATLTALTELDASTNTIADLGSIGSLTALTTLKINNNKLTSVSGLEGCMSIVDLNISTNEITDISRLSSLSNMMYFDFSFNQVTEIPSFEKSCALVTINGNNNNISSLKPLGGLKSLNNVHMDYNSEISSVDPLAGCPVLILVNVYETSVKNVDKLTDQSIIINYNPV